MTRHVAPLLAGLLCLAVAVGCGGGPAPSASSAPCTPVTAVVEDMSVDPITTSAQPALPVTVDSADGREVTIDDVSRILPVNLYGSIAEIVFSLGLGDRVIGRDVSTTFEAAEDLPLVTGTGHDLSAEAVLKLNPSVILTDSSMGPPEVLEQLRLSGIPVVMLDDLQTLGHLPDQIRHIASALGVPAEGEALIDRLDREIAEAKAAVPSADVPPTVAFLYIRGTAGVYLISADGAGPDEMIEAVGGIDAGTALGMEGFRPITSEALIRAAPDVILMMTDGLVSVGGVDGLLELPGIAQTPAGARHRIVDMDDGILLNFGTRTPRTIEALTKALYACS